MDDLISRQAAISEVLDDLKDTSLHDDPGTPKEYAEGYDEGIRNAAAIVLHMPSAQPEIIRCNSCKHWTQSTGKMKGYGLGRCDFHDVDLVTCNGFCYWAERRTDG